MVSFFGLKRYDVELSPPVKGRITDNGKPVAGIEVERRLFYSGYSKEAIFDYATTNADGEFSFEEKIVKSRAPGDIFGQNAPISQKIYIEKNKSINDENYCLWRVSKGHSPVPPLSLLMSKLNADLQSNEFEYTIDTSGYNVRNEQMVVSICDWTDKKILEKFNNDDFND
ncbi:DUF4198 domain-containing protein [Marinomonas lutimaris]|uniref:DUF4198 domain-containing protein n=1 Tax=Marinomonas lutimaris TaxID=2846746 RepID=UPI001CA4A037|nr:DUF4198 domain-containing protein [Marinomonas lutimaris]